LVENSGQIDIKPVSIEDLDLFCSFCRRAYLDHFVYLWEDGGEWYVEKSFSQNVLQKEMADCDNLFFLAWAEGAAVGFLKLKMDPSPNLGEKRGVLELERIYLTAQAQGKGIGKQMLRFSDETAKQNKKGIIRLKTMDSSKASIDFYLRNGFAIYGTDRLDFPLMKPAYRGMLLMEKKVS
jgi:diamine N-acetyltransferase